mgnify:CR=1 FL=1
MPEAVKLAQDFADDFTNFCNYPNDLSVSRISLYECSDGYFIWQIILSPYLSKYFGICRL